MNDDERLSTVRGCRWVDEVVPDVPYIMNEEYINYIIDKYQIDYVVHGDDPCIVDGKDVYETAKKMGKYKTIPRTEGISTTDIVGRMLLMTKDHHNTTLATNSITDGKFTPIRTSDSRCSTPNAIFNTNDVSIAKSNFLTTSHVLRLFSASVKVMDVFYVTDAYTFVYFTLFYAYLDTS